MPHNVFRSFLDIGPNPVSLVLQEAHLEQPRDATDRFFFVPSFSRVDSAWMPSNLGLSPIIDGHHFEGTPSFERFDFGRFLDAVEGKPDQTDEMAWLDGLDLEPPVESYLKSVETGLPAEPSPLTDSNRQKLLSCAKAWGPLGRRLFRLRNPERPPAEYVLPRPEHMQSPQDRRVRLWLDGGLKYFGLLEPAADWVPELKAFRATLKVWRWLSDGAPGVEDCFARVCVDPSLPVEAGWPADGFHFLFFEREREAVPFIHLLRDADAAKAEAVWQKRAESRRPDRVPDRERFIHYAWKLLELQISHALEDQLISSVRLLRRRRSATSKVPTEILTVRPKSFAGTIWLSLANTINGTTLVNTCSVCGRRYARTGRETSRNKGGPGDFCPRELSRKCRESVMRGKSNGSQKR